MTIKTRSQYDYHIAGVHNTFSSFALLSQTRSIFENKSFERVDSIGHPGWRNPRSRSGIARDVGGGFSVQRVEFVSKPAEVHLSSVNGTGTGYTYDGEIHANVLGKVKLVGQLPSKISSLTLNDIGTKGIRNNPVKPHGNLGQFLGELHDLPKLAHLENFKSSASVFRGLWHDLSTNRGLQRAVAKNYLNIQFGWKPFVSDLQKFFKSCLDADKVLRQLARDNGHSVRRRTHLPEDRTMSSTTASSYFTSPSLSSYLYAGLQKQYKTDEYIRSRWFSGSFRYFIPQMVDQPFWSLESNTQRNRLSRVVYGASMTPDLVWQLTPWSWLADWFGNVGDIVSNWTDIELNNLVIEHGYAMCTERTQTTWAVTAPFVGQTVSCTAYDLTEVKGRAPATPFGFGVDLTSINASQATTLAALGLARSR